MVLFKQKVKKIEGPLADLVKAHGQPEHHREFEQLDQSLVKQPALVIDEPITKDMVLVFDRSTL